jgi:hypothetical protein
MGGSFGGKDRHCSTGGDKLALNPRPDAPRAGKRTAEAAAPLNDAAAVR